MLSWLRCLLRSRHVPIRHPLGGFRCLDCGAVGADLDEMGFYGEGYLPPLRRVYSRDHGQLTRTSAWDTGRLRIPPHRRSSR
jgi:hypothetical protein